MSVDVPSLQAKQASGLTVGVVPTSGSTVLRLEIDDFIQDAELANLYFLATEAFMKDSIHTQAFSYYEISGIHGQPWRAWDNVTTADFKPTGQASNPQQGYCAHGSVLFPTWHRAYLAQFEQAMFLHASEIANALGGTAKTALDRFRIPYWDPLLPRQKLGNTENYKYGIPIIFTLPQVMVRRPEDPSNLVLMDNPLYSFPYPQDSATQQSIDWTDFFGSNTAVTQGTIRGFDGQTQGANHSWIMGTFDNAFNPATGRSSDLAGRLWRVMLGDQDYQTMSNHFLVQQRTTYNGNSLEGFHDDIHSDLGQGPNSNNSQISGHMAYPEFAGFDPVFWLHHCNIDRLHAIWQGIHSNQSDVTAWWTSEVRADGTFVEPAGEPETPLTPLVPFRQGFDNQSMPIWWTSKDVRDHRALGYDYPQTAAARQQGNLVQVLTAWANSELGWAVPPGSGIPSKADELARTHLQQQITERVQAFPGQILMDGTTPLGANEQFISSSASTAPVVAAVHAVPPGAPVAQAQSVLATLAKPVHAIVNMVSPARPVAHAALKSSLPANAPSFDDRFGGLGNLVSQGKMTQWNASFGVEKFALNGSFTIYFFLGDFNEDFGTWPHESNLAGSSSIFAGSRVTVVGGGCGKCKDQDNSNLTYYDTVGLTPALLTYWNSGEAANGLRVTSLDPSVVVPFLTRNLHWRIIDVKGAHIPRESVPSLKIAVYSETITLPQQLTDMPRFENEVLHTEITNGRPGGLNTDETF